VTGQGSYTWAPSTTDARGLQKAGSTTDRIAACWYSATNFTVDVNLTDGNTHRVALYTIDWDGGDGRQERIEVLDAESNAVLDSREVTLYTSGKYLVWTLKGHVKLKFTHLTPAGYNAVVSGLFFDAVSSAKINWLVTDQLGTPRMVFDKTGSLAATKRHDYLPFGEELTTQGSRTTALGYTADGVRQKFTQKERDNETGLDYFGARYNASTQGRFTSADPKILGQKQLVNPQRWNRYAYVVNNPLALYDPDGQDDKGQSGSTTIDIYISHAEKGDEMTKGQRAKLDGLVTEGAKKGFDIRVHDGSDATAEDAARSMSTPGAIVMFAGHTVETRSPDGSRGEQLGFHTDQGTLGRGGIIDRDETGTLVRHPTDKPQAAFVLALGCDSASLASVAVGAESYMGVNGQPSTLGQFNGIIAAVDTIVTAGNINPETQRAVGAAVQSAIRNSPGVEHRVANANVTVILNPSVLPPNQAELNIKNAKSP
jgi:RHS repeat-associated protein